MSASSSFLNTGIRRAFFQSVKVSLRLALYLNNLVSGDAMAGPASFNNLGGITDSGSERDT